MEGKEVAATLWYNDSFDPFDVTPERIQPNLLYFRPPFAAETEKGYIYGYYVGVSDEEEEEVESEFQGEAADAPLSVSKKRGREMQSESAGAVKLSWPEVVGWSGEAAVAQIERENENAAPIVVKAAEIASVSEKVRPNVVKIFVDGDGFVVQPPVCGGYSDNPSSRV